MKLLKRIGIISLVLLVGIALFSFIYIQTLKPEYDGDIAMPGLSEEVRVVYDSYGIPHIYAAAEEDAFQALGYVHAQDRLWQMELLRRLAPGGLSEVFGPATVSTDRFFLALGIDDATTRALEEIDSTSVYVQLSNAYLKGINQFIEEGPTPIEFILTGIEKEPYSLRDIHNILGYMAFSFAQAHKTDPLVSRLQAKLGPEYLEDLGITVNPETELIKNHQEISSMAVGAIRQALENLPVPLLEGSNSWVIAPSKTRNGQVIFANDPHIGFAQPSVWYEAHIVTPEYEKYGYHLGGIPFPLLAHDRNLAYGMTMFENDDLDFYRETLHPEDSNRYKGRDGWKTFKTAIKTIKVKDSQDVEFTIRSTERGPLLNGIADQIPGKTPVSMSWIYTQGENRVIEALHGISHAANKEEFVAALPKIHAPGLNIMYGDASGNVAWWATAKLYLYPDSVNSKMVLDGANPSHKIIEYLDFSENPQSVNPPWGYVYSANNQPDSIKGTLYPGYYLPENRAKRIVQLLESKDDWDLSSVQDMILDVTSAVNPGIVAELVESLDTEALDDLENRALDRLVAWEGDYPLESVAASVYHRWVYYLVKDIFEDEMGEELFKQYLGTHLFKRVIAEISKNHESHWWDNTDTEYPEQAGTIIQESFKQAVSSLEENFGEDPEEWVWEKLHTIEHGHPIGREPRLRSFFNVGPFPIHGTREVINNLSFVYDADSLFQVSSGPSTRRVIDFSDIDNSTSILPTGQSGNPWSPHYDDQALMFVNGKFRKMLMDEEAIEESSTGVLRFVRDD